MEISTKVIIISLLFIILVNIIAICITMYLIDRNKCKNTPTPGPTPPGPTPPGPTPPGPTPPGPTPPGFIHIKNYKPVSASSILSQDLTKAKTACGDDDGCIGVYNVQLPLSNGKFQSLNSKIKKDTEFNKSDLPDGYKGVADVYIKQSACNRGIKTLPSCNQ